MLATMLVVWALGQICKPQLCWWAAACSVQLGLLGPAPRCNILIALLLSLHSRPCRLPRDGDAQAQGGAAAAAPQPQL